MADSVRDFEMAIERELLQQRLAEVLAEQDSRSRLQHTGGTDTSAR
jgi:hypothetical protein